MIVHTVHSTLYTYILYSLAIVAINSRIFRDSFLSDDQAQEKKFIQQLVADPLLIDGHKFEIGVYVVITSIDPMRLYVPDCWVNEIFNALRIAIRNNIQPFDECLPKIVKIAKNRL